MVEEFNCVNARYKGTNKHHQTVDQSHPTTADPLHWMKHNTYYHLALGKKKKPMQNLVSLATPSFLAVLAQDNVGTTLTRMGPGKEAQEQVLV